MSGNNLLVEVLAAHADQTLGKAQAMKNYLSLFPRHADLASFLKLADLIRATLTPVEPDPGFKEELRRELLAAHWQQLERENQPILKKIRLSHTIPIALTMIITVLVGVFLKRSRQDSQEIISQSVSG